MQVPEMQVPEIQDFNLGSFQKRIVDWWSQILHDGTHGVVFQEKRGLKNIHSGAVSTQLPHLRSVRKAATSRAGWVLHNDWE